MMAIQKRWVFGFIAVCLTALVFGLDARSPVRAKLSSMPALSFGLPIDCQLGQDCYIMHYVDRDSSPNIVDFGCGRQTYDGHNGTDFGIADLRRMEAGVPVLAVAGGKVLRVRDTVEDHLVTQKAEQEAVQGQECGNGVVIDHGNGWSTQYCHLKQSSIRVRPQAPIKKGTVLGLVGSSGLASFPHVHLTARYQGKVVDPFVGVNESKNCQIAKSPLWTNPLPYVPTGLVQAGFAPQVPTQLELWQGLYSSQKLSADIPALVFWVHSYGVLSGDIERWRLINPQGETVIQHSKVLKRPYRSFVSHTGHQQVATGQWYGEYQLIRNNQAIINLRRSVVIQ